MTNYNPLKNWLHLRITVVLLSTLLSILAFYTDDIINPDGILYIYMVQAFIDGGLSAMAQLYNWPFFSIITALFSQITHISAELSAKIICTILFVLFTDTLLLLSQKTLPCSRHIAIAAVLILFFYTLNNYREFIIRDTGYWAFCCLALYQFLCFIETKKLKHAFLWQLFILVAILFRVEGVVLMAFIPLFVLFSDSFQKKRSSIFPLYYLIIFVLILSLTIVISNDTSNAFGKIVQITQYLNLEALQANFITKSNVISNQILHPASASYGSLVLSFGLVSIAIYSIIKAFSVPYLLLTALSFKHSTTLIRPQYLSFLLYFFLINVFILIIFTLQSSLVTGRYNVLTVTILFLILLPTLCQFIDDIYTQHKKTSIGIVILLLTFSMGDTFIDSNSKSHIKEVAKWAASELPDNTLVMTTNPTVEYYFNSNRPKATITLDKNIKHYKNYDYIILHQKNRNKKFTSLVQKMSVESVYEKSGNRDKSVLYKVHSQ